MEHQTAALALIERIQVAIENHDTVPAPEQIHWGHVGYLVEIRNELQAISDRIFGGEARLRPQVGQVALRSARPDAHQLGRTWHRAARRDVGGQDVALAPGRWPRECAAQVPVSHASRSAAAIHSSRPSMGIR